MSPATTSGASGPGLHACAGPQTMRPCHPGGRPLVVFSHALGGTRQVGEVWGGAWAAVGVMGLQPASTR